MLAWPIFRQLLESIPSDPPTSQASIPDHDISSIMMDMQSNTQKLARGGVETEGDEHSAALGIHLDLPLSSGGLQLGGASLSWETVESLCKAYFDTFNFLYPIMDRQFFTSDTLASAIRDGFDEGTASTLACLVFALGEVALADSQGITINDYKSRSSGVKGGTAERPPGISFFNEARKRLGFAMTECSLENVQIHALAG
jgi:hypothetical protein